MYKYKNNLFTRASYCNSCTFITLIQNILLLVLLWKPSQKTEKFKWIFIKKIKKKNRRSRVEIKGGGSQEIEVSPPETLKFNYFPWDSQEEIANSISPCQERLIKKISLLSSLLLIASFPIPKQIFSKVFQSFSPT